MAISTTAADHEQDTDTAHDASNDERTPLLQHGEARDATTPRTPLAILITLVVAVTLITVGDQLMDSPTTRLLESVCCYEYFQQYDPSQLLTDPDGAGPGALRGIAESVCKIDKVQGQVATIRSYQYLLEGFPALALAVPFGWLQDRYGRRPFLLLGMFSIMIKSLWIVAVPWFWQVFVDMRWLWASAAHALLMGGSPVLIALYYTIIADITTEESRATVFLRLGACSLSAAFFAPIASAWLMRWNPWYPMFLGAALEIAGFGMTFFIPETLNYRHPDDKAPPVPIAEPLPEEPLAAVDAQLVEVGLSQRAFQDLKKASQFLWEDYRVPILILPFFVHILLMAVTPILVQYASKRYSYSISTATLLVTVRSGVNIVLLFSILPYISKQLMIRLNLSGKYKDLLVTRVSLGIMGVGWILLGFSPTAWLFVISLMVLSLGSAAMFTLRSFLTSLIPPHQVGRAYSVVCIVDTLGVMFGTPILAKAFELGMNWGEDYLGLPFYLLGVICLFFTLLLMTVRLRKDEHAHEESDD